MISELKTLYMKEARGRLIVEYEKTGLYQQLTGDRHMRVSDNSKARLGRMAAMRDALKALDALRFHALGGFLLIVVEQLLARRGRNFDPARFHLFRQLADEIDVQEAVFEIGAGDLDMVGKAELTDEAAPGDAAMEIGVLRHLLAPLGADQEVFLDTNYGVF